MFRHESIVDPSNIGFQKLQQYIKHLKKNLNLDENVWQRKKCFDSEHPADCTCAFTSLLLNNYLNYKIDPSKVENIFRDRLDIIKLSNYDHRYILDKKYNCWTEDELMSASKIKSYLFPSFPQKRISENIVKGIKKDISMGNTVRAKAEYLNIYRDVGEHMAADEIRKFWIQKGLAEAKRGTDLHSVLENSFFSSAEVLAKDNLHRKGNLGYELQLAQYVMYFMKYDLQWEPFAAEISIINDRDFPICGTFDCLMINRKKYGSVEENLKKNGTLRVILCDWKVVKEALLENRLNSSNGYALSPISELINASYDQYCIQQNTYRYILENNYNIFVEDMFLIEFVKQKPMRVNIVSVMKIDDSTMLKCFSVAIERYRATRDDNKDLNYHRCQPSVSEQTSR